MPQPKVALLDPSAFTPPYDRALAAALARAGADVELITSRFIYGPVPAAEGYAATELFYRRATALPARSRARLPLKAAEHIPGMLAARRRIRDADVAHWQWVTYPPLDRHLLGRRTVPRVITLHYPLPPPDARRALAAQRRFLARFDAVIAHTEGGAERLCTDVGLDPEAVHVIPHGPFDYLTRLADPAPLPEELRRTEGPVILFFGLLRPYKGIDDLLDSFARLGPTDAELWIAGMPRMPLEPLRERAERAPGTVRFIPRFIPDPEIPALMRRADVLALPYREIEQSGVLHTGLAFGKPMVLSDVGGFSEVARRHGAARLVPPGDADALAEALAELVADPAERERLARAAAGAVAGDLGWDAIAGRTLELYAALGAG